MKSACVTVDFDEGALVDRIEEAAARAQMLLDTRVLSDANYWCPLDTGTLIHSAELATRLGTGQIEWRAPYAAKQYWGDFDHTRSLKPHATAMWFETAKAQNLNEWKEVVDEVIRAD